ncbi:hypothetical protein Gohar_024773 [Gossypium harknessii]|uniref:CCHC-type domain-containing protein n=1 Tax=Gossypium harknessii TaxID=34285 RepID=A0A7J9HJL2_9ROSI|nr:hypothetical protein [Gossypium harknessii]
MLSFSWISSCDRNGEEDIPPEDPNTKKVRFKESNEILEDVMVVEPSPMPSLSWKDLLVGKETIEQKDASGTQHVDDSFSLLEQDVKKSVVNGIPSIDFSERIYQLLEKEMATSVVLKMLGRNIGSSQPPIQKADPHGDWGNGRKSNKLDFNIDSRARGRIANMVVYVNLRKPLISKLFINGNLQKIEYENLLVLCFSCERYGHNKESCLNTTHLTKPVKEVESTIQASPNSTTVRGKNYGPWMLVEQQTRCLTPEGNKKGNSISEEKIMGSRFQSLAGLKANSTDEGLNKEIQQELKRNGKAILTGSQGKSLIGKNPATVMTRKENLGQPV